MKLRVLQFQYYGKQRIVHLNQNSGNMSSRRTTLFLYSLTKKYPVSSETFYVTSKDIKIYSKTKDDKMSTTRGGSMEADTILKTLRLRSVYFSRLLIIVNPIVPSQQKPNETYR